MADLRLLINKKEYIVNNIDPSTPLLWVLRDELGLVGTKYGCGGGFCGACTVHLEGTAIRACSIPAVALADKAITTIEGLSADDGSLHPLQAAWIQHDVPQCGYCQAGQIMSAAALLANNPQPTEDDIARGMEGNICRCGCYNRITDAIQTAAVHIQEAGDLS